MNEKAIHLPGLNGLRSVAALSVLVCHIFYTDIGERYLLQWPIAHYAVTMFYVISRITSYNVCYTKLLRTKT